ncbi:MAG: hypothetical protein IT340_10910, partial [Chloroflexi bacterium]|nr:hypothetical protein [Chloroflexota bacterium]
MVPVEIVAWVAALISPVSVAALVSGVPDMLEGAAGELLIALLLVGLVQTEVGDQGGTPPDLTPLREEMLSQDRLEHLAVELASNTRVTTAGRSPQRLIPRLIDNERALARVYTHFARVGLRERFSVPAAQWLLDNYHAVQEQVREVRQDLPRGYERELPRMTTEPYAGFLQVYRMAVTLVAHTDSQLDDETLTRFVQAYQTVRPLRLGELWAFPIALRLALIENLRRLAEGAVTAHQAGESANRWLDDLLERSERPSDLVLLLADGLHEPGRRGDAFLVQVLQRLHDSQTPLLLARQWLEQRLAESGLTADALIRGENQRQAANHVSVGNVFTSMRTVSSLDWATFVERVSLVEGLLRHDPVGAYARMDFATRDRYRHEVEDLARRSGADEVDVARRALALAGAVATPDDDDHRLAHVGYYLIDAGRPALERALRYRPALTTRLYRLVTAWPTAGYLAAVLVGTAALLAVVAAPLALLVTLLVVAAAPVSELAIGLVNWLLTLVLPPRRLPKLDFSDAIPPMARTVVAVPVLLTDEAGIRDDLDGLTIRALANYDVNLTFVLLSDFADAPQATMPDDERLLAVASDGIRDLNARDGDDRPDRFVLLHRPRRWNPLQERWMGWERKRGKLHELNRWLRGADDCDFAHIVGDARALIGARYVITLDADTQLPPGIASRLIGAMAHPLNRPVIDPRRHVVVAGYGIVQPRVSPTLGSALASPFARLFAGEAGLDPYTTAVSDVYQDLWGEGSYIGKGIYDVDAFEATLAGRAPDNALLSHDLFEGLHARTALAADIEIFEDYPSRYLVHAQRQHRWARGDWQLLPWLLPWTPTAAGTRAHGDVSLLGWWKLFDNLRRSLVAPSLVVMLLLVWLLVPGAVLGITALALLVLGFPVLSGIAGEVLGLRSITDLRGYLRGLVDKVARDLARFGVTVVLLAHQAALMVDAMVRTLVRLMRRRNLLEWVTAAQSERGLAGARAATDRMWPAVAIAAVGLALVSLLAPASAPIALPLLLAWLVSPILADRLSRPARLRRRVLTPDEARRIRLLAYRTWRFFVDFVGPADHWLPPDNFQEEPKGELAHRTSPTNIGLLLLSTLAAHDLGYLTARDLLDRLERTLATMTDLERFQGHFYNWYDTETRAVLPPAYVSTVDSGNLVGHLIALKQGLLALGDAPLIGTRLIAGLRDAAWLLEADAGQPPPGLAAALREVLAVLQGPPVGAAATQNWLARLTAAADALVAAAPADSLAAARAAQLRQSLWPVQTGVDAILPWLTRLPLAPAAIDRTIDAWRELLALLDAEPTLASVAALPQAASPALAGLRATVTDGEARAWLDALAGALDQGAAEAAATLAQADRLAAEADGFIRATDFRLLYDGQRDLFAIGYRVADGRLDNSAYDLLASEARLASFVAIAKGDVPLEHWFRLGRPLTRTAGGRMLLSWSGTMFEYLMPLLVMRRYPVTLLDETYDVVVRRHIAYGRQRGVPWGISEAAYAVFDLELTYQYRAFGVPGTGLRRGLSEDLVVAPYASILAGPVDPRAVLANLDRLARLGLGGRYGLYESIDYTAARQPERVHGVIVRTYMAHHQGMILVTLANWLDGEAMVERFHTEPATRAVELLLQERLPRQTPLVQPHLAEVAVTEETVDTGQAIRHFTTPQSAAPRIHLLSNSEYGVMITNAGAGYSYWRETAISRWREDTTRDHWGFFIYVRDLAGGPIWSSGYQPTTSPADVYDVTFAIGKAEIRRRDRDIETHTEIAVSPEDDVEVRRVTLLNLSDRERALELTSYAEIALATPAADAAHPAFSKLFVETEHVPEHTALLASRRPRAASDGRVWALHTLAVAGEVMGAATWETDRARFLGRGRTPAAPAAVVDGVDLSGTVGAVLDPIFSLRQQVRLAPGASVSLTWALGAADSRESALALAEKYTDPRSAERALAMAWTYDQIELHHLNLSAADAHRFLRLAARLLYSEPTLRPPANVLGHNRGTQAGLWRYGISGDLPIVLVQLLDAEELGLLHELLRAHEYWRRNRLFVDLVILNEDRGGYQQALHERIQTLVQGSTTPGLFGAHGGVSLLRGDTMSEDDRVLFLTVARAVLVGSRGDLERQLAVAPPLLTLPPRLTPRREPPPDPPGALPPLDLLLHNGLGGFTGDGREYIIEVRPGVPTPAPWSNIIANPVAGCLVTEAGPGYTWVGNSRENRLTPWSNDPVSDGSGEALYLRDEETGAVWSATPRPCGADRTYRVRHGQGYTTFEHLSHGLAQELTIFVPPDDPVRLWRLRLTNRSGRPRRLSATAYVEWVLGVNRESMAPFVVTEIDRATGALLARNAYNGEFAGRIAFAAVNRRDRTLTADRLEFIGRNGSCSRPAGLGRIALSGRVGAGLDPCAALQAPFDVPPDGQVEIVFVLGEAADRTAVATLVSRYYDAGAVAAALAETIARWEEVLGGVQVRTPEPAWDVLLNRWLLYQTQGCRVWARSAFYQSGGAYGFRDQIQ